MEQKIGRCTHVFRCFYQWEIFRILKWRYCTIKRPLIFREYFSVVETRSSTSVRVQDRVYSWILHFREAGNDIPICHHLSTIYGHVSKLNRPKTKHHVPIMKQRISWCIYIEPSHRNFQNEKHSLQQTVINHQASTSGSAPWSAPVTSVLQVLQTQNPRSKTPWGWIGTQGHRVSFYLKITNRSAASAWKKWLYSLWSPEE
jgi:hypothetical protein